MTILLLSCFYASANNWNSLETMVDSSSCQLSNLTMSTVDVGTDMFEVTIDFDHANTSATFDLEILLTYIGTYNYSDLPITVGPLNCVFTTVAPFIKVSDSDTLSCTAEIVSPPVLPCSGSSCDVDIATIFADCDSVAGGQVAVLNINAVGTGGVSTYSVWVNGTPIEDGLAYGVDHSIILPDDGITALIQIVDVDSTCVDGSTIVIPDCSGQTPNCNVDITNAVAYCDGGLAYIDFEIDQGIPPFIFLLDSMPIANLVYNPPTYTAELPNVPNLITTLEVIDVNGCISLYPVTIPDCSSSTDCDIEITSYVPDMFICNPDGTVDLALSFTIDNGLGNGYELYINNAFYDYYPSYPSPDDTLFLSGLSLNAAESLVLEVYDYGDTTCYDLRILFNICQDDGPPADSTDCSFSNPEIVSIDCVDSSSYLLTIDFDYIYEGLNGFNVSALSGFPNFPGEGDYSYADLPLELGPIPTSSASSDLYIHFTDLDFPMCDTILHILPVECMLPGDTDGDSLRLANNKDLLKIGLAYSTVGPEREDQGIDFSEKPFYTWSGSFDNGRNYGHADCNGDGLIDEMDILAIEQNYIQEPVVDMVGTVSGAAPLYVNFPEDNLIGGTTVTVPIVLGSSSFAVTDIYGLAFTLQYDGTLIVPGSISVDFTGSLMGIGSEIITIARVFEYEEKIDIGISRINGSSIGGYGDIGYVTFALIENIEGRMPESVPFIFEVANLTAITPNEQSITLDATSEVAQVVSGISDLSEQVEISVGPIPSSDYLYLENKSPSTLNLSIVNSTGQLIKNHRTSAQAEVIDIDALPAGIYIVIIDDST